MALEWQAALDFLYGLANWETRPAGTELSFELDRVRRLLRDLGDPHRRWPAVHVAGTNGKGSTAAMIASILGAAGYRTGLYTSPHLHTVRERIQVDGAAIGEHEVLAWITGSRRLLDHHPGLTTFEALTALAFQHFAESAVDIAVVEVGLGGRLDTTNVVEPLVSVVMPIGLDHTDVLGRTVAEIAADKAGILRAGVPFVCAPQPPEAEAVLRRAAEQTGAPFVDVAGIARWCDVVQLPAAQRFRVEIGAADGGREYDARIGLLGPHQRLNAACALVAASLLADAGWRIDRRGCEVGLATARWPGRFEVLAREPDLVVDGAHNPPAACALAAAYRERFGDAPCLLVVGASRDKDVGAIVRSLLPIASSVVATCSEHPRAMPAEELAAVVRSLGAVPVRTAPTPADALETALARQRSDEVVLATGSIFLVADVREAWAARGGMPMPPRDPPPDTARVG